MKKRLISLLSLLLPLLLVAQNATVSGTVVDTKTGETLIGATVVDTRSGKGTVTNLYGRYSLTLKQDSVSLKVSFVGYEPQAFQMKLERNRELNVKLTPSVMLEEVVIIAERAGDTRSSQMSATEMTMEKIKSVPVMFGEADLIKALQLMPGVQSGSEGNSGMYVRGGGPDENLFLLDGVPLYNVSHMGGFFSAFNTDAIKNVTLYKGSFPARFGGRLSAVLDVTQNNGNDKELHGNLSIGLISAKFNIEGPIVKEKTTFSISARRTYAELFLIPLIMKLTNTGSDDPSPDVVGNADYEAGYWFYDLNAKITHKFSDRSRLYASWYMGDDKIHGKVQSTTSLNEDVNLGFSNLWGNMVGALRWNYALTPRLFMNVSGAYTQYSNNIEGSVEKVAMPGDPNASTITGNYKSGIREGTLRTDFDFTPNPDHDVKFGTYFTRHWFQPEVANASVSYYDSIQMNDRYEIDSSIFSGIIPANEIVAFIEDDWSITDAVKLNAGLHFSGFRVKDVFYPSLEPRISGRVMLTPDLSVKAGYAEMSQYVHLLSTTSVTLPTDLWVPVTDRIKPMRSRQVAAGVFYSFSGIADFSLEAYYKQMDNIIEYKDGATFFGATESWENLVYTGEGKSYGVEFLVQRDIGRLTGWLGYTWSRTTHLFDRPGQVLNNGKEFPAKYDRRHDISIVLSYKVSPTIDVSATWVFSSGSAASLATQSYPLAQEDPEDYDNEGVGVGRNSLNVISGRNNYRLPDYHRLDLGANFHRKFKRCHRTISVSIYNVYNRQNPYMLYRSRRDTYRDYPTALVQLSLFPILPSVGYTLYF
ncbi:MAG: carboxypeptidase-like regulatory domain-containing protein [Bacteroidales bacterium]|nr:carboxypeptidase-like regulatory domain-containing protein [Bacteroidales bacterium]